MAAYGLAIFTGAFLLFQVQPLIAKYLLPWFGGAPGVWTTCMLFFQVALLGGYGYAHLSAQYLRPRGQVIAHLGLVTAALLALPIIPHESWKGLAAGDPTFRIIALLVVSVGLPYFALSATAPLLQHWFTLVRPGVSPFRLYALSNAGSLLALLSYPSLVEVWFTRSTQAHLWGGGLVIYAAGCLWAGAMVWRNARTSAQEFQTDGLAPKPSLDQKVLWVLLPACASVLLLAVTNKICQDVAVIPFLWILPLTLYLLSFIFCFETPRMYHRSVFAALLGVAVVAGVQALFAHAKLLPPVQIAIYSFALFVCCMVCHGEVYRLRPSPAHLTAFYLLLSFGGAAGGIFVGLVAPRAFGDYYELHLGLGGTAILLAVVCAREQRRRLGLRMPAVAWGAIGVCLVAVIGALINQVRQSRAQLVMRSRNFYGVLSVYQFAESREGGKVLELAHGRVGHGAEIFRAGERARPTMYYTPGSGVGRAASLLRAGPRRLGLVGLGVGTLAAYGRDGDVVRFYEINPEVERIARSHFSFLKETPARAEVVIGDARRSMESEAAQGYDLLALDAFSSDAVPLHLLTREAFELYRRHLGTDGILAVHVSNQSLNLEPPVVRLGREGGFHPVVIEHRPGAEERFTHPSTWVLLFQNRGQTNEPILRAAARPAWPTRFDVPRWTDDFAALLPVVRWEQLFPPGAKRLAGLVDEAAKSMAEGRLNEAARTYERAAQVPSPSPGVLNNLAWIRATAADPGLRNGGEAVRLAQTACGLTERRETLLLGTLAAAYAEAGEFELAVSTAEEACAGARQRGESALLARNQELLELYRRRVTVAEQEAFGRAGK